MVVSNPLALGLLVVLPFFVWLGWPRIAHRRARDRASLLIRLVIMLLLILGLADLQVVRATGKLAVVFLLDGSDSIDQAARARAEKFIRDAMSQMGPEDQAGIVVFGKNALVERPVSLGKDPGPITSKPIGLQTNIAAAIRLGLAMFPANMARRLVLLSDGDENADSAVQAAQLAAASKVQLDILPLGHTTGPEMQVTDVRLPTQVNQGETFDLGATVTSTVEGTADLSVFAAGSLIQSQRITVKAGDNNFVMSLTEPRQGFTDFQVRVAPVGITDPVYQNKELAGFTEVTGPPRVLLVTSKADEVAALQPALQQQGIQLDVQAPGDLPSGLAALASYKSVILANVSAIDLTDAQMRALQSYVRDLGGGLVAVGGPNSFGPGGYFQTPLEQTLPVDSRIKDQKRLPSLLIVYIIDRSGSMEVVEPGSTVDRLELGKEAIRRSVQLLQPQDRVGVVSYDTDAAWQVPIQQVTTAPQSILDSVGALRPGGGDGTLTAMQEAYRQMASDPTTLKHVIVLTDGDDSADLVDLTRQMYNQSGITVSAIDIESGEEQPLKDMAVVGRGVYYHLVTTQNVPQIFVADTVFATRSYIQEKLFTPGQSANSPILQGISALPTLKGYVITTPKDTANVILNEPGFGDPLLAAWQYGLGRAVAWTSDATARWAANWTSWDAFSRFWSQAVRWTITEGANSQIEAGVEQRNGQPVLVVDARDQNGAFLNSLTLDAAIVDPQLQAKTVQLKQVAPGRYEADFEPLHEGAYFIRINGVGPNGSGLAVAQTSGWVMSYSPEYRLHDTNASLLDSLTRLTGGQTIEATPGLAFDHSVPEAQVATSVWPWLLLAVAILLPIDIGLRRLLITPTDVQKITVWLAARFVSLRPEVAVATSGQFARLIDAKARASAQTTSEGRQVEVARASMPAVETPSGLLRRHRETRAAPTSQTPSVQPSVSISPTTSDTVATQSSQVPSPTQEVSLASRLVTKRRDRSAK